MDRYELGAGFGHIALEVGDACRACEEIKKRGGKVVREAGPDETGRRSSRLPRNPMATALRADTGRFPEIVMRTTWLALSSIVSRSGLLIAGALLLRHAPFVPEPHLWEKLKMLAVGTLTRPIDIFDLLLHASLPVLLALKLIRRWDMRHTGR